LNSTEARERLRKAQIAQNLAQLAFLQAIRRASIDTSHLNDAIDHADRWLYEMRMLKDEVMR
jgi:hypothetical protein